MRMYNKPDDPATTLRPEALHPDQLKVLEQLGFVRKRTTLHGQGNEGDVVIYEATQAGLSLLNNLIAREQ